MEFLLYSAAALVLVVSGVHSLFGEKYIIIRLPRRNDLPRPFGSDVLTRGTLRSAWHATSVAWPGLAAILVYLAQPAPASATLAAIVGVTFLIHFLIALIGTRGQHLFWIVFLAIAVCALVADGR